MNSHLSEALIKEDSAYSQENYLCKYNSIDNLLNNFLLKTKRDKFNLLLT